MVGTRDELIHPYFGVDPNVIWKTIIKNLPPLKEQISEIQKDLENTKS
jgi:uncharacterized protein with HEPN domain